MGVTVKVEIKDYSKQVIKELGEKVEIALKAVGQECEGYAKADCPVDTGRLRNSITYAVGGYRGKGVYKDDQGKMYDDAKGEGKLEDDCVYIGTNVDYAERIEYGDMNHRVGKKHFLRDAAANHKEHYKAIIEAVLKS